MEGVAFPVESSVLRKLGPTRGEEIKVAVEEAIESAEDPLSQFPLISETSLSCVAIEISNGDLLTHLPLMSKTSVATIAIKISSLSIARREPLALDPGTIDSSNDSQLGLVLLVFEQIFCAGFLFVLAPRSLLAQSTAFCVSRSVH